jgi:hypothetical protein
VEPHGRLVVATTIRSQIKEGVFSMQIRRLMSSIYTVFAGNMAVFGVFCW